MKSPTRLFRDAAIVSALLFMGAGCNFGVQATASASPNTLTWRSQVVGTPSTKTVTISVAADSPTSFTMSEIQLDGDDAVDFKLSDDCTPSNMDVIAGTSFDCTVTFTASKAEREEATLAFRGNVAGDVIIVDLSGSARGMRDEEDNKPAPTPTEPETPPTPEPTPTPKPTPPVTIAPEPPHEEEPPTPVPAPTPEPDMTLMPTSLAFDAQVVGSTSAARTIALTSTGDARLIITGIEASGDFATTNTCGSGVEADLSCTIFVTFTPTASGARSGTLSLASNAGNQTITLSGTGEAAATDSAPTISSFTPTSGEVGEYVTITGTHLLGTYTVKFDDAPATFTILSDTQVRATVPAAATSGKIRLTAAGGAVTSTGTFSVTEPAGPAHPGQLGFAPGYYSPAEDAGHVTITVTRTGGSDGTVTVNYATQDVTATTGVEYAGGGGVLTFGAGVTSRSFTVGITDDAVHAGNKEFLAHLNDPTGGATLGADIATVLIMDDES